MAEIESDWTYSDEVEPMPAPPPAPDRSVPADPPDPREPPPPVSDPDGVGA